MLSRWIAWPVLVSLVVQALVIGGAPGGSVVLCLGGEDHEDHDVVAVEVACISGCGHHSELPMPSLQRPHMRDCSCVDLVIATVDLRFRASNTDDRASVPQPVAAIFFAEPGVRTSRPAPRAAQPPPDLALAALRTVRLLT